MILTVANFNQKVLFECELKGQISDGYWENSRPHDHWKIWCRAEVNVDPENIGRSGVGYVGKSNYNFAAGELLKYVGDRMIYWVKFYTLFPEAALDSHWDYDFSEYTLEEFSNLPNEEYYNKKKEKFLTFIGMSFKDFLKKMEEVSYTKKDLKKDLEELKKAARTVRSFN